MANSYNPVSLTDEEWEDIINQINEAINSGTVKHLMAGPANDLFRSRYSGTYRNKKGIVVFFSLNYTSAFADVNSIFAFAHDKVGLKIVWYPLFSEVAHSSVIVCGEHDKSYDAIKSLVDGMYKLAEKSAQYAKKTIL